MERITDVFVFKLLNDLYPNAVHPTREQKYLSFLVCKNLSDLCQTGRALVNNIEAKGHPIDLLPDRSNIQLCQQLLNKFYTNQMFIPDDDCGSRPNWTAVNEFNKERTDLAHKLYLIIRKNIIHNNNGNDILEAIKNKDKTFFLNNFDKMFADIPSSFSDALVRFKNFIASPYALTDDQAYIWDFFESLVELFIYEQDNLKDLQLM